MGVCKLPQGVGKEMMMRGRLMQQQQKLVRRGKQGKRERSQIRFTPIPFFEGFHVLGRLSAISDAGGVYGVQLGEYTPWVWCVCLRLSLFR